MEIKNNIDPQEILGRFILYSRYFREDNTVRPDAFMPHPYSDLSVTRHINLSDEQLKNIGLNIALTQNKNLYGRADVRASVINEFKLSVKSAPVSDNPNHANIKGWPVEKSAQKSIALQITAFLATCVRY